MKISIRFAAFCLLLALVVSLFCFAAFAEGETAPEEQSDPQPAPSKGGKIALIVVGACVAGGVTLFLRWQFMRRARKNDYSRYY